MNRYRIPCLICILILLFAGMTATIAETDQLAEDTPIVNHTWTSYTNGNWINDLAFDNDGYLWAATSGGAVRWETDTGSYIKYTAEHGLCSNQLGAVAVAPDGAIWFASKDNGLSRFENGVFQSYTMEDGLPSNVVNDIAITPDGVLWVATDWDLCSFDGQSWQIHTQSALKETESAAEYIVCDAEGSLWFGSYFHGVFRLSGSQWTHFNEPDALSSMVDYLTVAADGSVWASLLNVDLVHYTDEGAKAVPLETDKFMAIDCFYIEEDGTMWLSNWGDIIRIKDGQWETFSNDYTQDTETTCIIQGSDGTIWCGGFMGGLAGYKDGQWRVLQTDDWLPDNSVHKIVQDAAGGLWILSGTAVSYYDGQSAQVYPTMWRALDLLIAPDDSVWVSLGNNGVYRFDGLSFIFHGPGDSQDGFEDNSLGAFLGDLESLMGSDFDTIFGEDSETPVDDLWGDIDQNEGAIITEPTQMQAGIEQNPWYISIAITLDGDLLCVSADETVHRLSAGVWSVYEAQSDAVSDLHITEQGVYWLSCAEGLYCSEDGTQWTFYPEIIDPNYFIYHYGNLYVNADNDCWIASLSGLGCQPADGDSFYFAKGNGIPDENISCVTGAPDGTIWIGTTYIGSFENGSGAGRYDGTNWQIITAADGLASNAVHDILITPDSIWFATNGGISVYQAD